MSYLLDIILVAIVLICVLISAKKGFVRTIVETVGFIAAIIIAFTVSSPLAVATYDNLIEPPIITAVEKTVGEAIENSANEDVINALPDFLVDNSELLGLDINEMKDRLSDSASASATEVATSVSQDVFKPVVTKVVSMVYSLILVIILLVVVKFLARLINKLFSFSILGKLNAALGGVLGVVKGLIISIIVCLVVSLLMTFMGDFFIFTSANIDNSILFKFIINTFVIF